MAFKILVMGLSGSGKTTLAKSLVDVLLEYKAVVRLNADIVRETANDWDFSEEGRTRQAHRLKNIADRSTSDIVVCDFIAPLPESREIFNADYTIWMNTVKHSKYRDTDDVFNSPTNTNIIITRFDYNAKSIANSILSVYN